MLLNAAISCYVLIVNRIPNIIGEYKIVLEEI